MSLVAGSDRRLTVAVRGVAALGLVAIFTSHSGLVIAIALCLLLALSVVCLERQVGNIEPVSMTVFPTGRCRLGHRDGRLAPDGWLSRWYCVLICRTHDRRYRVLISASRQQPDEYRKLLAWMRLQTWE